MCMQSWGRSSYARGVIELRVNVEFKDIIMVAIPKLVGEGFYMCTIHNIVSDVEKNWKNPRQAARGVQVGPNVAFKLVKQVYRLISSSDKKKEAAVASKEYCTTPIAERIDKIERKVIGAKLTFVDDDGKPLHKVVSTVNVDSDSKVEDVVDDHAVFMASTGLKRGADSGYGTNSLLEQ
ncbi:hypothetical protein Tco_1499519 [Tanacetum coccineum]